MAVGRRRGGPPGDSVAPPRCGGPARLPTTQPQDSGQTSRTDAEPGSPLCPGSGLRPRHQKGRYGGVALLEPRPAPSCFQGGLGLLHRVARPPPGRSCPPVPCPPGPARGRPGPPPPTNRDPSAPFQSPVMQTQLTFFPVHHRQYFENYSKITQKMKSKSIQNTNSTFF